MTTSNKLFIVETQDWVVGVEEFWVEDNLDSIARLIEKVNASDLVEDRVGGVVRHVVGNNRGE